MKTTYQKPAIKVEDLQQSDILCYSTRGNADITGGNEGSTQDARVKELGDFNFWEEEWGR